MLNGYFYGRNFEQVESEEMYMAHWDALWRVLLWPGSWQGRRAALTSRDLLRWRKRELSRYIQRRSEGNPALVRNLYHIFLLYTTIVPLLSSSFQNRFRSVRGRAQWAQHGESSTSSERIEKESARERTMGWKGRQEGRERKRKGRRRVSLI